MLSIVDLPYCLLHYYFLQQKMIAAWQGQKRHWNRYSWFRFTLAKIWLKFVTLFLCLRCVISCFFLGLCLGGDWPRTGFNKWIKPIIYVCGTCLPIQKSPFLFHNRTKEVIFILDKTTEMTLKVHSSKDFFLRQKYFTSFTWQRAGLLCSPCAPEEDRVNIFWIKNEQAMSYCYIHIRVITLSISLSNW